MTADDSRPNTTRERLPYRLNAIVAQLRDLARETDTKLECSIADFVAALENRGVIGEDDARAILAELVRAFASNTSILNVLNLLDESGSEPALREVERIEEKARQRKARK